MTNFLLRKRQEFVDSHDSVAKWLLGYRTKVARVDKSELLCLVVSRVATTNRAGCGLWCRVKKCFGEKHFSIKRKAWENNVDKEWSRKWPKEVCSQLLKSRFNFSPRRTVKLVIMCCPPLPPAQVPPSYLCPVLAWFSRCSFLNSRMSPHINLLSRCSFPQSVIVLVRQNYWCKWPSIRRTSWRRWWHSENWFHLWRIWETQGCPKLCSVFQSKHSKICLPCWNRTGNQRFNNVVELVASCKNCCRPVK